MPIYMNLSNLPGASLDKRYEGWHEIHAFSWGASNPGSITQGGKVMFSDFSVTMSASKSASKIMLAVATGKHLEKGIVAVTNGQGAEVSRYTFDLLMLNSFSQSHSNGEIGPPYMSLSWQFRKVTYRIGIPRADGSFAYETNFWDLSTNTGG
ncbi:MAG TPA: type VI secretion system tube protein Hcp [Fimbriimonas sp.]